MLPGVRTCEPVLVTNNLRIHSTNHTWKIDGKFVGGLIEQRIYTCHIMNCQILAKKSSQLSEMCLDVNLSNVVGCKLIEMLILCKI